MALFDPFIPFFYYSGVLITLYVVYQIAHFIWRFFVRPVKNPKSYGNWVVITGATDGIGKAYALDFARRGMNLVLISRTASKLSEVSKEILDKYATLQVKTIAIDFSRFDAAARQQVSAVVSSVPVGILVNNVGVSYSAPEYFDQLSNEVIQDMIELNIISTTYMTHLVLPGMIERKKGAILNISSAASVIYKNPLLTQYAAAKAYIDKFSLGLNAEYKSKGIFVQVQNPLYVTTKLAKIRSSTLSVPSPAAYVRAALRSIGYEAQTSPYWVHALMLEIMSLAPRQLVTNYVIGQHLGIRKRALAKKEKQGNTQ